MPSAKSISVSYSGEEKEPTDYMYFTLVWSSAIFKVLSIAIEHRHLEHMFIPGYNLLGSDEKFM